MRPPADDAWEPWSPEQLAGRLAGTGGDWYIVGGWALDLWLGRSTRAHQDLEFSVSASECGRYRRHLSGLAFFAAKDGRLTPLAPSQRLPDDIWQQWGADMACARWRVDMMVDRGTPELWIYKRDPSFSIPRLEAIRTTASGIRYLAPHLVLLFKAKSPREKDQHDFRMALAHLTALEKSQLTEWMRLFHPDHAWLAALRSG